MKLQDFGSMTDAQKRQAIAELARAAKGPPNGGPVSKRLSELENRYEMTTETMIERFKAGSLPDTAEISEWLVLARG